MGCALRSGITDRVAAFFIRCGGNYAAGLVQHQVSFRFRSDDAAVHFNPIAFRCVGVSGSRCRRSFSLEASCANQFGGF